MEFLASNEELSQLENRLASASGNARIKLLVAVAWQLRQSDCARAIANADEAQQLIMLAELPEVKRQSLLLRLMLVRGEVKWLFGELATALDFALQALQGFQALGDELGCADAYWLRAWIALDQGEFTPIAAALNAMANCSQLDPMRALVARAALVRLTVFFKGVSEQLTLDEADFPNQAEMHPGLRCWLEDCWGALSLEAGDYVRAVLCLSKTYILALGTNQIRRAVIAATHLADAFSFLNDYQSALEWHQRAMQVAQNAGWDGMKGVALRDTGETQLHLQNYEMAYQLLQESLSLLSKVAGSHNYAIALSYLGEVELARAQYASALQIFQTLEQSASRLRQVNLQFSAYRGQASALLELGQAQAALQVVEHALAEFAAISNKPQLQIALLQIVAEIYRRHPLSAPLGGVENRQFAQPLHYLQKAHALACSLPNYIVPANLLEAIAREYAEMGDFDQAYTCEIAASGSREQTHKQEAANRAKAIQVSHETERAQVEDAHQRELAAEAKRAEILHQTSEILEHLGAIGQEITAHLEFDQVFAVLNRHVQHLFSVNVFAVALFDDSEQGVHFVYGFEDDKPIPDLAISWRAATSKVVQSMLDKRDILYNCDPTVCDPFWPKEITPTSSRLFTPLCLADKVLGLITVQSFRSHAYDGRDQMILRTLSAYAAIALSNAEAHNKLATAHRQLQETQQQMVLQGKMAGLGTLTAGVAHEINNPTNFVHVAAQNQSVDLAEFEHYVAQLIEADDAPEVVQGFAARFAKLHANLNTVLNGTERIKGIVRDLRAFTRLDEADKKSLCLSECITSTLNLVRTSWLEKVEFICEIRDDPLVECWPALLNQVFMNLLVNGCQAIEEKLQAEKLQAEKLQAEKPNPEKRPEERFAQAMQPYAGKLWIRLFKQAGALQVVFEDNGIGMTESAQERVLEPFYTTKAVGSGTGLGLSIAFGIIEKHGGSLRFTSQLGQGSCFTVRLPLPS